MEIKTKYQYTYFIYPYIVAQKKLKKHLYKLLHNKNCTLKLFDKNQNLDLYTYFLPKIRDYIFPSFEFSDIQKDKINDFDDTMKATLLSQYSCTMFDYNIEKDIQGKTDTQDGIFFHIRNITIICFNTGICFLLIKTMLDEGSNLEDVCNFNYKFRDINSSVSKLKDFDNIKIQTDAFHDVRGIKSLIKDITGSNIAARNLNVDTDRFITYSYACIGQEDWNDYTNEEILDKELYRYAMMKPANGSAIYREENILQYDRTKYVKFASTSVGVTLLTSDKDIENYTKLPYKYENEYLYNYIYEIYKKLYLKKINMDFKLNNNFKTNQKEFINFTNKIWIEELTNNEEGSSLIEQWTEALKLNRIYSEVKQKYDIMYKNINIERTTKSNKWIVFILIILLIVNIINCISIFHK
jgi:hypothetical protein